MRRRKGKVEALGAILPGIRRAQQDAQRPLAIIQEAWPKLAGVLAAHSKPVSLRKGRLVVHVDQHGDKFALSYQRPQLLEKLNGVSESTVVEIVFRDGEI